MFFQSQQINSPFYNCHAVTLSRRVSFAEKVDSLVRVQLTTFTGEVDSFPKKVDFLFLKSLSAHSIFRSKSL